jgi:hypothetical protein
MKRAASRMATALVAALGAAVLPGPAQGQGASVVIGGIQATMWPESMAARSDACSRRFAATTAEWAQARRGFEQRQAERLAELAAIRRALAASAAPLPVQPGATLAPSRAQILDSFALLAALAPGQQLAGLDDAAAASHCTRWLDALAEGGEAERALPGAVAAARKLAPDAAR